MPQSTPPDASLWLIRLRGQSNQLQGELPPSGFIEADPRYADRIHTFTHGGTWRTAFEPGHTDAYGALYPALSSSPVGAGPGLFFAQKFADLTAGVSIGLIPAAVGGVALADQMPGSAVYNAGVNLTALALPKGKVKATIFIGNESDAITLAKANAVAANIEATVAAEQALYGPDLIFIFAKIGPNLPLASFPYREVVRAQQASVNIPGVYMVDTDDLERQADGVHLTRASDEVLGVRCAIMVREIVGSRAGETFF